MIGESIGSYRVVAKIGEGGMGAVYLGEHKRIPRKAAIKILLPELSSNHEIVERFFNEARATSLIKHPGIVDVTDCDVLPNGSAYIVMEFLEGESLGSFLRRGERLSVQRAAFLVRHVAHALAAAHDKGIVHRDLKPDNIFLPTATVTGQHPTKVLDFGIAKLLNTEAGIAKNKTRTGSIMGTPVYMSPEQCRGVGSIDHRTDIYSLGCLFFEMLCGRTPFTNEGFGELIQSHLSIAAPSIRSIDPALPPAVETLVARMLAKAPADRPQTMRDLIIELDAATADAPATAPTPPAQRKARSGPEAMPRVQTTLGSASAEKIDVVSTGADFAVPRTRRTGPLIGVGVAAAVVVIAIVALGSKDESPSQTPAVAAPAPAAPAPAAAAPTAAAPALAAVAPTPAAAPAALTPPPAPEVHSKPATPPTVSKTPSGARKVKVFISSDPPGAEVCLATDRSLLGKTKLEWSTERGAKSVKLMVRKTGYRGQDVSFVPSGDFAKRVELDKLGPDDIDDAGCRPR